MSKKGRSPTGYDGHIRKRKDRNIAIIKACKSVPCADCGIQYPHFVMQFDHVRGEKLFTIGGRAYILTQLYAEIEKCDVVCANCHCFRTNARGQNDGSQWNKPKS
jgi:hypothetical protein